MRYELQNFLTRSRKVEAHESKLRQMYLVESGEVLRTIREIGGQNDFNCGKYSYKGGVLSNFDTNQVIGEFDSNENKYEMYQLVEFARNLNMFVTEKNIRGQL